MGKSNVNDAMRLYRKARLLAWLKKIKSFLLGGRAFLPNLRELKEQGKLQDWQYIGLREIPIRMIVGSEEPCREFDVEFLPYKLHNLDHWLDIAFAKLIGINIPPIELIRVPSGYFAQSGHYRISVLRVMGHKVIQAYVTSWEIL